MSTAAALQMENMFEYPRGSRSALAAAAAAARGVDGGAAAPGGGGGDGLWCACSEINHQQKKMVKKRPTHTPQPWAMPLVFSFLLNICFRSPVIAAELRAVITARGSRYFLVRAAWATAAVCGFYYFLMIYFNQFYFFI